MTSLNKFKESKISKRIFTILVILLIFIPSFMIAAYHNHYGRIYGLIFYFSVVAIGIYELIGNSKIHYAFRFYYILLGFITFLFPIESYFLDVIWNGSTRMHFLIQLREWWILVVNIFAVIPPLLFIKNKRDKIISYFTTLIAVIALPAFGKWLWTLNSLNSLKVAEGYRLLGYGFFVIIYIGLIAALSDSFALLGGILLGRKFIKRGLAPKISPKKTWEGAISGFIFATIFAGIVGYFLIAQEPLVKTQYKLPFLLLSTFLLPIAAIVGDLFFSWIKRCFGIKDFSQLIPGHGGLMDRFDSTFLVTLTFVLIIIFFRII